MDEIGMIHHMLNGEWAEVLKHVMLVANEYGVLSTIVGALVFLLFPKFRKLAKIVEQICKDQEHVEQSVSSVMKLTPAVNKLLDQLMYENIADAAFVYQYHNGGRAAAGLPFAKASMTFERVQPGVPSHMRLFQNIPIGMMGSWNVRLMENYEIRIPNIDILRDEHEYAAWAVLADQGVKSTYGVAMLDINLNIFGFVGISYTRRRKTMTDEEFDSLKCTALKVCGVLLSDSCTMIPEGREKDSNEVMKTSV